MTDKVCISFVIPCYCSQHSISQVVEEIISEIDRTNEYDYEIILVNDGSHDNTMEVLERLHQENNKIVAVDLMRNFGQAAAQMAGFNLAHGDYVFSLDDDGQMPIESVIPMITKLKEGYDVVFGRYEEVKQSAARNLGSKVNAVMTEILLKKPKNLYMSSFWVTRYKVIEEIIKYQGPYPYIAGLLLRVTRNMTCMTVKQRERQVGKSNYTFGKLLSLWLNGFTAFSVVPLRVASVIGIICSVAGLVLGVMVVIRRLLIPTILIGYSSIIVAILFVGGVLMMLVGMLGEYMGRIYLCINQAPQFVIRGVFDQRANEEGVIDVGSKRT